MAKSIVEITGFPELERKIKALGDDKSKKREVIGILKQVASSTVKAAKQTAPISKKKHTARGRVIQPGNLKKSIGTIVGRKGNAKDNPTVYVGPRAKIVLSEISAHNQNIACQFALSSNILIFSPLRISLQKEIGNMIFCAFFQSYTRCRSSPGTFFRIIIRSYRIKMTIHYNICIPGIFWPCIVRRAYLNHGLEDSSIGLKFSALIS